MIDTIAQNDCIGNVTSETDVNVWTENDLNESLQIFEFSKPLIAKQEGTWRFFYNNCNGLEVNSMISTFIQQKKDKTTYNYLKDTEAPTKLDSLLRQMKIWEVDIVSLAETCVAWEDHIPRRVIQNITQRYDNNGCWSVASSKINVGSYVKPGGTGILSAGRSNGTIVDRGSDPWNMGRWSYARFTGKKESKSFLLITGYRPGKRNTNVGVKTAWAQQRIMMEKEGNPMQPHEAFFVDMSEWLTEYKTADMEVLLW